MAKAIELRPIVATGCAAPSSSRPVPSTSQSCRAWPRPCQPRRSAYCPDLPQSGATRRGRGAGRRRVRDRLATRAGDPPQRPARDAHGRRARLPRVYRGRDIQWWMLASGVLDQRSEEVDEPERATLDLNVLRGQGVEVVGRRASTTGRRNSPGRCTTSARSLTSR